MLRVNYLLIDLFVVSDLFVLLDTHRTEIFIPFIFWI